MMSVEYLAPYITLNEARCKCYLRRKEIEKFIAKNGNICGDFCWGTHGADVNKWDEKQLELWPVFRKECGDKPITINSGARCRAYNNYIYLKDGKRPTDSQHIYLRALDPAKVGWLTVEQMVKIALSVGYTGVGIYNSPMIHVDTRPVKKAVTWDYRK